MHKLELSFKHFNHSRVEPISTYNKCHWLWSVSSAFHLVHSQTFPGNILGNVSAIMDVFFWKAAANKWTHLFFMSCKSDRFSYPSHTHTYYSDLSAIMPHVILMILEWMLLYNTDGAEKQPHTPSPSTDKQCDVLFSPAFPCHVASHNAKVNWFLMVIGCCLLFGISYVAVLGFQASFTAWGSMCRPFLCQQCHVFLWQGQRDNYCTTSCVIQYNRKAVFHNFYLWNIFCNRFFCRSDEQIIPCTIFLTGDYIPSCWHPCGLTVMLNRLTSSVTILKLMSVQYTPVWVPSLFNT